MIVAAAEWAGHEQPESCTLHEWAEQLITHLTDSAGVVFLDVPTHDEL